MCVRGRAPKAESQAREGSGSCYAHRGFPRAGVVFEAMTNHFLGSEGDSRKRSFSVFEHQAFLRVAAPGRNLCPFSGRCWHCPASCGFWGHRALLRGAPFESKWTYLSGVRKGSSVCKPLTVLGDHQFQVVEEL